MYHDEVALAEQLAGYVNGGLQVAPAVVLEVEYEAAHALLLKPAHAFHELVVCRRAEIAEPDVAYAGAEHVNGIDALHRDFVPLHGEAHHLGHAAAHYAEVHRSALGAAQAAHDVRAAHLHAGYGRVVDAYYAVAGHDADLL